MFGCFFEMNNWLQLLTKAKFIPNILCLVEEFNINPRFSLEICSYM